MSYDRKAYSAEPQTAAAILGKRWEDLIDAAASATEEDSRDLTPVCATASDMVFKLTKEGAPISVHVTTHDGQSEVVATLHGLTTTVISSIAAEPYTNTTTGRHVRVAAVPFCRILHRVSNVGSKLPHTLTRPFGLIAYFSLSCPNLLCCLPQAVKPQGQLRVLRVHLRPVPGMR